VQRFEPDARRQQVPSQQVMLSSGAVPISGLMGNNLDADLTYRSRLCRKSLITMLWQS
jgi:hypothetical protein